jgi:mevalonate kinase
MKTTFYSHGKLLLFGEYAVLDGALALAVPTRPGQSLEISPGTSPGLSWTSLDQRGEAWLQARFTAGELQQPASGAFPKALRERLLYILQTAGALAPGFLPDPLSLQVTTRLEFPREWGLGTSSTLLANIAAWSGANPYDLLERSMGGSGYDLACARAEGPVFYQLREGRAEATEAPFRPGFARDLLLVYLGQKQDSREGIARYRERQEDTAPLVLELSRLSDAMARTKSLDAFMEGMRRSEALLSDFLGLPPVGEHLFSDFDGAVKSLGAWGGDFILAAGGSRATAYFREKGFPVQLRYSDLVLEG